MHIRNLHTPIGGVLFDLDNTLFDRDRTFLRWAQWFVRDQLAIANEDQFGSIVDLLVELDANGYGPKGILFQKVKDRFPQLAQDVHTLTMDFFERHLDYVELEDDTVRLLDMLRESHVPWGIVTNGSRNQLLKIRKLGFDAQTSCIFVSEVEGVRKPDRDIFLRAARCLQVATARILFVGDNPEADIQGAAVCGMRTAWLHRGRRWPDSPGGITPDLMIRSLADLVT